jgi:hypothetical protein
MPGKAARLIPLSSSPVVEAAFLELGDGLGLEPVGEQVQKSSTRRAIRSDAAAVRKRKAR